MSDKVVITDCNKTGRGFANHYAETERDAILKAGFDVLDVSLSDILTKDTPPSDLHGKGVFLRHSAHEEAMFARYVDESGATLLVSHYEKANDWYKVVPQDKQSHLWLGDRTVKHISIKGMKAYRNDGSIDPALDSVVDTIFTDAKDETMFIKAPRKRSHVAATLYDRQMAREAIKNELVFGFVHGSSDELIYSDPMDIAKRPVKGFNNEEYRCLIVGDACSTTSIYTRHKRQRHYGTVEAFAQEFATNFKGRLPNSYCLDIARLVTGEFAVVELNDIAATGFYADIDIYKFFTDVYALPVPVAAKAATASETLIQDIS